MSELTLFSCPVCNSKLTEDENKFFCENNHCYDKSKYGYVNLLLSQSSSLKRHGDDKTMVLSRREFLNKGYYEPLLKQVEKTVEFYKKENGSLIDIGCGEGYYISSIKKNCRISQVYGIDISKTALRCSAKSNKDIRFAVASAFSLPFNSESADIILNIFAPCAYNEFYRVLSCAGYLIKVVPLSEHLWELKQAIYEKPYKNKSELTNDELFKIVDVKELKYEINLPSNEDIFNLFTMTPYYYKTSKSDIEKLLKINNLKTTVHFAIEVYEKRV